MKTTTDWLNILRTRKSSRRSKNVYVTRPAEYLEDRVLKSATNAMTEEMGPSSDPEDEWIIIDPGFGDGTFHSIDPIDRYFVIDETYDYDFSQGTLGITATEIGNTYSFEIHGDLLTMTVNGKTVLSQRLDDVQAIEFAGSEGNDVVDASGLSADIKFVVDARGGDDTITGGRGGDTLVGGSGNDMIRGGDGDDVLYGNSGNDELYGGEGNDRLKAGTGHDQLSGGNGDDVIDGQGGRDRLVEVRDWLLTDDADYRWTLTDSQMHGQGNDSIKSIESANLTGSEDDDIIDASRFSGDVTLNGGWGLDVLIGGRGNDVLRGGGDEDTLIGNDGSDRLLGGGEADFLKGGRGNDRLLGQGGADTLIGSDGNDRLNGGSGFDRVNESGLNRAVANKRRLNSNRGSDRLRSIEHLNLTGTNGSDTLDARNFEGSVRLRGKAGDDVLYGAKGRSWLVGGEGTDLFFAGRKDRVFAADGARDVIVVESGSSPSVKRDSVDEVYTPESLALVHVQAGHNSENDGQEFVQPVDITDVVFSDDDFGRYLLNNVE